ncbi:M42 family peptidase [Brevibacillus nitrificans]|uniref:M42 family peptidase n=1 Tax=Brevibacillus nitrificans TaxID=651560 RepID=A0A3M8CXL0_9BACL|nr:M42 family metallopeptidase [Brevibacillus nitrificans]MED1796678.1 M42 family metallopeptidase [Brevibacillus nitrificans]RNB80504.1 M42 family peptidase [Brevibacillus nitrificans]
MNALTQYLSELDAIHGVSGDEERVANYMKEQIQPFVDESFEDALGNQFFVKKGTHPTFRIMLAAHMDEIGFVVSHIDEKGFVYFLPVGYHDSRMVINQILTIQTETGPVHGITGGKPAHVVTEEEAQRAIPMDRLHLDLGTTSRAETLALGVQVGDYITFDREGRLLNGTKVYSGKSVDNRSGCAVLIEVMKRLADKEIAPTVYGVATVQEEVGLRGAGPAAFSIQPDISLAIDVIFAGGTPGMDERISPVELGAGPAIMMYDWTPSNGHGNNVPKKLTRTLIKAAEKNGIPYQREVVVNGGTDAWAMSLAGKGSLAGGISLPSRYIHSATGIVHMDDLEHAVQLILAFVEEALTDPRK